MLTFISKTVTTAKSRISGGGGDLARRAGGALHIDGVCHQSKGTGNGFRAREYHGATIIHRQVPPSSDFGATSRDAKLLIHAGLGRWRRP